MTGSRIVREARRLAAAAFALAAAVALPLAALAQGAGGAAPGKQDRGWSLLWLLAALLVGLALFRLFFGRTTGRPSPPVRRP